MPTSVVESSASVHAASQVVKAVTTDSACRVERPETQPDGPSYELQVGVLRARIRKRQPTGFANVVS